MAPPGCVFFLALCVHVIVKLSAGSKATTCYSPRRNGQLASPVEYVHGFCWFVDGALTSWQDGIVNTDYGGRFYDWFDVRPAVSPEWRTLNILFADRQIAADVATGENWVNLAMHRNVSGATNYANFAWRSAAEGPLPITADEVAASSLLWAANFPNAQADGYVQRGTGKLGNAVTVYSRATLLKYRLPRLRFECEQNRASTYGLYSVHADTESSGCMELCRRSHYCYSLVTHGTQCTLLAKLVALHRHTVHTVLGATLCYVDG